MVILLNTPSLLILRCKSSSPINTKIDEIYHRNIHQRAMHVITYNLTHSKKKAEPFSL